MEPSEAGETIYKTKCPPADQLNNTIRAGTLLLLFLSNVYSALHNCNMLENRQFITKIIDNIWTVDVY